MPDWVLTTAAVRDCIAQLREYPVHPYFPAYLHLRQRAALHGDTSDIKPKWDDLSPLLQVDGAPPSHPHFRPFTINGANTDQEWLNANLAGSYAPSSLRVGQPPLRVVELSDTRGRFNLPNDHWVLARVHLLSDEKLPLLPLAGFFLRDYAFSDYDDPPGAVGLVEGFTELFGYTDDTGEEEVDYLYELPDDDVDADDWFEEFDGGST